MRTTRLATAFDGEDGDAAIAQCSAEADAITANEFFNGVEPNNQEACTCEGQCKDGKACGCEGECNCAEDRFSFKDMLEGMTQKLGDIVDKIHEGKSS